MDGEIGAAFRVSGRSAALVLLLLIGAALACRLLDAEQASTAALKTITAIVVVGIVPGALITLLWRPRPQLSLLEIIGFGTAISFGVVQLLTILAVSAHLSPVVMLSMLLVGAALAAGRVIRLRAPRYGGQVRLRSAAAGQVRLRSVAAGQVQRSSSTIVVSVDELIVLLFVAALGWSLYVVGAPVDSAEDQIHAAIARRLSQLETPRFDNLYVTPGIVYTYPFPGTHYFMGLIARLGEIDALFLYHKIRCFWGTTALVMLYLIARAVFGKRAVACAVAATAVVLVWNGSFAMGFPTGWGQLVPYSHASDIAMTVLLPSLLAVAFWYVRAESTRERAFHFTATAMLALMLTMVHMREIVQFAAYLGCFAVVAAASRDFRPYFRRTVGLLALTLVLAAIYTAWQGWMVPLVDNIVDTQRAELLSIASARSLRELIVSPASTLFSDSLQKFDQIFIGLMPFFLFAGPVVVLLFRREPLVWLISSTTVAYLAVMSVPLLAIPYIYFTYFEILHLPVRNIIFFVYALAGAVLYAAVVALTRIDRTRLSPLIAGTVIGALALLTTLCLNRSHQGFFVPLIAAYGLTFVLSWGGPLVRRLTPRAVVTVIVILVALVALWPDHAPVPRSEQVTIRWISGLPDAQRATLEEQLSLAQGEPKPDRTDEVNVWNYRLTDLSADNVSKIVAHPDVVDTHFIDRSTFAVESQPPTGDHLPLGVTYVRWLQYPGRALLVVTALLIGALGLIVPAALASTRGTRAVASLDAAMSEPFYRRALPFALFLIPFAVWSMRPTVSPLTAALSQPTGQWETPRSIITKLPCVTSPRMQARFTEHLFSEDQVILPERTMCPPEFAVVEWMQTHIPVDAVLAIDRWDPYPPVMFSPQQAVVFPTLDASFIREDRLFDDYYAFFYERMRRYRVQPFFNTVETSGERDEFVEALGVTHIIVNPAHYDTLRPVLDNLPDKYVLRYDHAPWAVYEVKARG